MSVSMVTARCRRLVHAALCNGHPPYATTGAAHDPHVIPPIASSTRPLATSTHQLVAGLVHRGAYRLPVQLPLAGYGDLTAGQLHPHVAHPRQRTELGGHRMHAVPAAHS